MRKAQEEVTKVLGDQQIQLTDLGKLTYLEGKILPMHFSWLSS
jgi:hypothetical protein